MKKGSALSAGTPFSILFPNVELKGRAENSIIEQEDSGYPRFEGSPDALLSFASSAVFHYTTGSHCIDPASQNEATKVLEFSNIVRFAAQLTEKDDSTEISSADLGALAAGLLQADGNEPAVGSNSSSPDKGKTEASASPATPKPEQAEPSKAGPSTVQKSGNLGQVSAGESALDRDLHLLHEYVHGKVLKELSDKSHTELVISATTVNKLRAFRGAMELSKNLLDQANFKKKKEQVPSTAVVLGAANFDLGIMDRRTYVVSSDGNVGYGCCFIPNMKGVEWTPGKMRGKDIRGTIVFSSCFQLFNKVDHDRALPFEATKSTLYAFEVIAKLCCPELARLVTKAQFWERLRVHAEAETLTAVRVLEPMFQKPRFYDSMEFKDGKRLPDALTSFGNELRARACATAHLRELARHHENLSRTLIKIVEKREHEEAEGERQTMEQLVESMGDDELDRMQEMLDRKKRRKLSGPTAVPTADSTPPSAIQ